MGQILNPVIPDADCTLSTCSLLQAHMTYVPSLYGNAIFVGIFGLVLVLQLGLGIHYKTWGFLVGMVSGLILEVLGYVGRIMEHHNPFPDTPFLLYLVCLTIGPAFLAGSVYLCLARIVVVYGEDLSRFRPRNYTLTFMTCDFFSLLLQAAGGALASSSSTAKNNQTGINVMIAGLSFQVFTLALFMVLCFEFGWRVYKARRSMHGSPFGGLTRTLRFRGFLIALGVATLAIFTRSVYRVAELSGGFHGKLANNEVTFMILEGGLISIAVISLTIFHPGVSFAGAWSDAGWNLRSSKDNKGSSSDVTKPKKTWMQSVGQKFGTPAFYVPWGGKREMEVEKHRVRAEAV